VNSHAEHAARAALTYLAEPGDEVLGALLAGSAADELLAAIKAGRRPATDRAGELGTQAGREVMDRAFGRWRLRLPELPPDGGLARGAAAGMRLICPSDEEWPAGLNDLGRARPYALWLRGNADLRFSCLRSVSVVGSRAASGYGTHVAAELAAELAEGGWTLVSGGAYGIDAAVHRGALMMNGTTIAVLACAADYPYPAGHASLFAAIAASGLVISEWPPGSRPTRLRFLSRNRVIAALTGGTVVVEAGERSGALSTAKHAAELHRPLMAVPGPVTSAQSAGCHTMLRDWGATCVTCAGDVAELIGPLGAAVPPGRAPSPGDTGPSRDELDLDSARVLDAFPSRGGATTAKLAMRAGVDPSTVLRCLGRLAGDGFIQRCGDGWRLRR
jgi:DNA processing protein